jgi:RNA polymerase sigma-70 factor (ECF subfamily)
MTVLCQAQVDWGTECKVCHPPATNCYGRSDVGVPQQEIAIRTVATMKEIVVNPAKDEAKLIDDELMMLRLKERDRTALSALLDQYGSMMYSVALRLMRDETRAQDVVQDALITIWNKAGTYEGRAKPATWLYRITVNAALMQLRKQRSLHRLIAEDDLGILDRIRQDDVGERPDVAALRGELGEQVRRAIDTLPEPYRSTLILADVEELPIAEVADLTDVSVAAAKSRLYRARLTLREELAPYLEIRPQLPEAIALFGQFCSAN